MEPESSKRECWAVSAGNSYEQEERMVISIIIPSVLAIIIPTSSSLSAGNSCDKEERMARVKIVRFPNPLADGS